MTTRQPKWLLVVVTAALAISLTPSVASANAGTPLIWASLLHLAIGNAIIGLIEGSILSRMFKCPKRGTITIIIAANYVSAWAGGLFLTGYLTTIPDLTIQNIRYWFLVFMLLAFLVTMAIEFPFVWFALRSQERAFRKAVKAAPVVNAVSYVLLIGWYWLASGTSMLTELQVVSPRDLMPDHGLSLYYISTDGDWLLERDLASDGEPRVVSRINAHHISDRLFARANDKSSFDLFVHLDSDQRGSEKEVLLLEDFSPQAPVDWQIAESQAETTVGTWSSFGPVPSIAGESSWKFRTGFWPLEGINGHDTKTTRRIHFSLETPFAAWNVRNATQVDGDCVVFQLGRDQICILHPESKRIALIARGKGPIVARKRAAAMAATAPNGGPDAP